MARMVTAPVRRFYERRYKRQHKTPRIIFLFDVVLIAVIAMLLMLIVWLIALPPLPPSIGASFQAPAIQAGAAIPASITITSKQNSVQSNVRVEWILPPGVSILHSSPRASSDNIVDLGDLYPGKPIASHVVLQVLRTNGTVVPLGFHIHVTDNDGVNRDLTSFIDRKVEGSNLHIDIPQAFQADEVAPHGAVLPLRIKNASDISIPFVEIRSADSSSIVFDPIEIGTLQPGETQYAFIPLGTVSDRVHIAWAAFASSREIISGSFDATVKDAAYATITDPLIAQRDGSVSIHVEKGDGQTLAVIRPFANDDQNGYVIQGNDATIDLLAGNVSSTQQRWIAAPIIVGSDGKRSLGPASFGIIQTPLAFQSSVVYRSSAGDQLGAGPQPPVKGEETRYWVFWHAGPFNENTRSIHVSATLPAGIRATGAISNPDGGSWSVSGQSVDWKSVPILPQGMNETTFAFEIAIHPTFDVTSSTVLIEKSRVTALDASTGATLSGADGEKTVGDVIGN